MDLIHTLETKVGSGPNCAKDQPFFSLSPSSFIRITTERVKRDKIERKEQGLSSSFHPRHPVFRSLSLLDSLILLPLSYPHLHSCDEISRRVTGIKTVHKERNKVWKNKEWKLLFFISLYLCVSLCLQFFIPCILRLLLWLNSIVILIPSSLSLPLFSSFNPSSVITIIIIFIRSFLSSILKEKE